MIPRYGKDVNQIVIPTAFIFKQFKRDAGLLSNPTPLSLTLILINKK